MRWSVYFRYVGLLRVVQAPGSFSCGHVGWTIFAPFFEWGALLLRVSFTQGHACWPRALWAAVERGVSYFLPYGSMTRVTSSLRALDRDGAARRVGLLIDSTDSVYTYNSSSDVDSYAIVTISKLASAGALLAVRRRASTRCILLDLGRAPIDLKLRTLSQLLHITASDGTNVICTSYCVRGSNIRRGRPAVSCRANDVHSSFSFKRLILVHTSLLRRCTTGRRLTSCG